MKKHNFFILIGVLFFFVFSSYAQKTKENLNFIMTAINEINPEIEKKSNFNHQNTQQVKTSVSGRITDSKGEFLIGVSVIEVGTLNGTASDVNGNYAINVESKNSSLKFSYTGYKEKTVEVGSRGVINIILEEQISELDELIVVGYGTQRKSDLTGAISSINIEDNLKKMPTAQISDILQGRIAGLSVINSSGVAGSEMTMRVRGVNSIKADGGPLVVVDGFPSAGLSTLNPADIRSIEVLKDASSTAIYGSRGANGVILVTTKTPQKGKVSINYSGYVNIATPYNLPEIMPVGDFARMANEWNQAYYGKDLYSPARIANFENGYDTFDYMGNLINDYVINHSNDINISGGTEKSNYLFSLKYTHDEGIAGISYNDKINYRLKLDSDLTSKLRFGANFFGVVNNAQSNGFSGYYSLLTLAQQFPQTVLPYDANGNLTQGTIDNNVVYNPMGFLDEQKRNNNLNLNFENWFQLYLEYKIFEGLSFRTEQQFSVGSRYWGITNSTKSFSGSLNGLSSAEYYDVNSWGWRMSNVVNYTKEFNGNNRINATIGMEEGLSNSVNIRLQAQNLISEKIGWKNMLLAETVKPTQNSVTRTTSLAFFGRVNYVFMNRYMATATLRRDASSTLAYDNRSEYFPSFSAAWDMKQESFLQDVKPINQLKLRYGYGVSGNQAVPAYSAFSTFSASRGDGGIINYELNPGNRALRWEKTYQSNFGLDLGLLKNRITLTFDYYNKMTDGAINTVILPDDTGQSSRLMNSATITNDGYEITLGAVMLSRGDFYWKADLTMAHNESRIKELGDIDSDFMELGNSWGDSYFRFYEGQRIGTIYGLQADGVWTTEQINDPNIPKPTAPVVRPGSYKYVDQPDENGNVDGIINASDYVIIGDGQPVFNWGMNNQLTYKNFDLNLFLVGFHGFDIYNYPRARLVNNLTPFPELANRWIAGVNENAIIAGFGKDRDAISNESVASSAFVEKGDFVKLKNITLGYTFNNQLVSKINLSSVRAYLSIQNIYTITGYSGNDPEMTVSNPLRPGLDAGTYPSARQYLVGVNISF